MISVYFLLLFFQMFLVSIFWRKIPSYILAIYIFSLLGLLIRPILYFYIGKYNYHVHDLDLSSYIMALYYYLLSITLLILVFFNAKDPFKKIILSKEYRYEYIFFSILAFSIILLMFYISGYEWLHSNRTTTISTLNNTLRYFYPAALYSATVLAIFIATNIIKTKRISFKLLILSIFSMTVFLLISQRGFLLIVVLSMLLVALKLKYIKLQYFIYILLVLIFYGLFSRSLGMSNIDFVDGITQVFVDFVHGGNGTEVDSMSATFLFLRENDYQFTFFNEFLGFLSHRFRIDNDCMTASDILNMYLVKDWYYDLGFGYNFNNLHMYILNFGSFLGFFFYTVTLIFARVFLNIYYIYLKGYSYQVFLFYLLFNFLVFSFSTLHWLIYFIFIVFIYKFIILILKSIASIKYNRKG